jgi:prolyl 4-hydroxylase
MRINDGQRMVTCFMYLNDLQENQVGHTEFNKLNIKVAPKKGRLLVFYNTEKDTNKLHDLSMHGGNEIVKGEKWACNIWFRDKPYNA